MFSIPSFSSYDKGFDDVLENEDYDWDRYDSDMDYASGVDDAMGDSCDGGDW